MKPEVGTKYLISFCEGRMVGCFVAILQEIEIRPYGGTCYKFDNGVIITDYGSIEFYKVS